MGTKPEVAEVLQAITPFALPADPEGQTLYDLATAQVTKDAPGLAPETTLQAQAYYVAHLMDGKKDGYGVSSARLGQYSVTRTTDGAGTSQWLSLYQGIVKKAGRAAIIAASGHGVRHADGALADMINLDASMEEGYDRV